MDKDTDVTLKNFLEKISFWTSRVALAEKSGDRLLAKKALRHKLYAEAELASYREFREKFEQARMGMPDPPCLYCFLETNFLPEWMGCKPLVVVSDFSLEQCRQVTEILTDSQREALKTGAPDAEDLPLCEQHQESMKTFMLMISSALQQ